MNTSNGQHTSISALAGRGRGCGVRVIKNRVSIAPLLVALALLAVSSSCLALGMKRHEESEWLEVTREIYAPPLPPQHHTWQFFTSSGTVEALTTSSSRKPLTTVALAVCQSGGIVRAAQQIWLILPSFCPPKLLITSLRFRSGTFTNCLPALGRFERVGGGSAKLEINHEAQSMART